MAAKTHSTQMPSASARRAAKNSPKSSPQSSPSMSPISCQLPESQAAPSRVVQNGELEKPLSPPVRSFSMPPAPPALALDRDEGEGPALDERSWTSALAPSVGDADARGGDFHLETKRF